MKDKQVYCTDCIHFRLCDEGIPYCINEDKCDIENCEDSMSLEYRPFYEELKGRFKEECSDFKIKK